jgi:hypothetical protein
MADGWRKIEGGLFEEDVLIVVELGDGGPV